MHLKHFIYLSIFLCFLNRTLKSQSVGGVASGSSTYCDTVNSGFVSITGYVGNVTTWQVSINGGASWTNNSNTFTSQSYFNLKQSTCYRAIVKNGASPPDTSTIACITIYLPTVGGVINGGGVFCNATGAGTLNLLGKTGNVLNWQSSLNNGSTWTIITNTTTSLSYTNITQNTVFMATVQNSSFCKVDTSSLASFTVNALSNAGTLTYTGNDTVCFFTNKDTLKLNAYVGNVLNWMYSTNSGLTWSSISNITNKLIYSNLKQTTLYKTVVKNKTCPNDTSSSQPITVLTKYMVSAGNDTSIYQGQSFTLNGQGSGSPQWSPSSNLSNSTSFNPIASPSVTTTYILSVKDINSCINSDTVLINVIIKSFDVLVSNVFSPNGDGINDNWYIKNISNYNDNEVSVYNIYGIEVFSKKGYNNDWQGTYNGANLPDGTYFYVVKTDNSSPALKGSLDILRNK